MTTKDILAFFLAGSLMTDPCLSGTGEIAGPVVSVLDGDTIEVLHNNRDERIRLSGIDCPEKRQAYGQKAKHATSDLAFGKKSPPRPMGTTSTSAPLPRWSCLTA